MDKNTGDLSNTYVKDYYNSSISQLSGGYCEERWFSSEAARLDYKQTEYVIQDYLKNKQFNSALEVGPGDGVWTRYFLPHIKALDLVEQSEEMLKRAQKRVGDVNNIKFNNTDFLEYQSAKEYDVLFAIRCLEYFNDKDKFLKKVYSLLKNNGEAAIVTKNSKYVSLRGRTKKLLHSGQLSKREMVDLIKKNNFEVLAIHPATFRWLAKNSFFRFFFLTLHRLVVSIENKFKISLPNSWMSESFIYIFRKK